MRGEDDEGGDATGGGTTVGAEPPTSGSAGNSGSPASQDQPMSNDSGGCSLTSRSSTSSGALLGFALAALGLGWMRRRR